MEWLNAKLAIIGNIFTVYQVGVLAFYAVVVTLAFIGFLVFIFKKQQRLFRNIKKPLLFINLSDENNGLQLEAEILRRSGFFNEPELSADYRTADTVDLAKYSLVVIAVNDGADASNFQALYSKVGLLRKPVVIYTLGNRNSSFIGANNSVIKGYAFHTLSTTPLRLVSDIFSILSTFPI